MKNLSPQHFIGIVAIAGMALIAAFTNSGPFFSSLDQFVLVAEEEIHLAKNVQVSSGDLASNEKINILKENIINGNIFAGEIELEKDTIINGNISFNKLKTKKETQILGIQTTPVSLPIANIPDIPDFQIGEEDFKFEGQDNTLSAGAFGKITLEKDSRLTLTGGTYNINRLFIKENSTLIFITPTTLNIQQEFKAQQRISILPGADLQPDDLMINYLGKKDKKDKSGVKPVQFGENSFLNFRLLAPEAEVHIGEQSTFRGQVLAKKIKVDKDSVLSREEIFSKESDPTKVVEDQGVKFIVNEIVILFKDEATQFDAQQVADLVNGRIIGFIPVPKIFKIEVLTITPQELTNKIQIIKNSNNPLIVEVVHNLVSQ